MPFHNNDGRNRAWPPAGAAGNSGNWKHMFLVRESTLRPCRSAAATYRGVTGGELSGHVTNQPHYVCCSAVLMVAPPPSGPSHEHRSVSSASIVDTEGICLYVVNERGKFDLDGLTDSG